MKKKLFLLLSIFFLYFNSLIAVTYNSEPEIFIQELVDDAVKTLSNKSLTSKEKNSFIEKIAIKSLTSRLTDYSSQKFEVLESEQKNSNYTIVKSKIAESVKSPEIKIDWRVYTKNPQKPLIRDLIVEGLSLARTQKEEFSSILSSNNNDVKALISKLEEFVSN